MKTKGGASEGKVLLKVKGTSLVELQVTSYTQTDPYQMIGSPSEAGLIQFDNRIRQPIQVQVKGIVNIRDKKIITAMRGAAKSNKLSDLKCSFMTKVGEVKDMIIENIDVQGDSHRYNGVEVSIRLKEFLEHNPSK